MPADLGGVLIIVGLTVATIFVPGLRETPLRVLFGLAFVLFIPGYVFIAALFPEAHSPETTETSTDPTAGTVADTAAAITASEGGIDGIERVALSFGTSIAIVPLIGLVLNFTPWGIRLVPVVTGLVGFTVVTTWIAVRRRQQLPPDLRFAVPYRSWIQIARQELLEPDTRRDSVLNVLLICSLLLATASIGYAVAVPQQGESFSEFYLLTENDNGELVADNYPQEFSAGANQTLTVGIGNQEYEPTSYSVVVVAQEVQVENNSTQVLAQQQLHRFQTDLAHNETWQHQHTVSPTMTGDRIRLTYLLYRGSPPESPSTDTAYRELHLWVTVSE